jgi:linoleoyl-CoA desaturase
MSTTVTPPIDTHAESPLAHLSPAQLEELAREFDAIRDRVAGELGERDRRYIEAMIEMQRRLAVIGRVGLLLPRFRPLAVGGASALAAAKILENMEIGHNVMHGQWDWMNDPRIHSSTWDWDTASTAEAWKHSHNYVHHTFTNIRGKDKDLGYEIMRIDPLQKWHPVYLLQPLYNVILAGLFEWGVALHDLDFDAIRSGKKPMRQVRHELKGIAGKARDQFVKDYVAWPLVSALASAAVGAASEATKPEPKPWRRLAATPTPTWRATSGPTRSSSAATSPTRPTPTRRRKSRTRAAAAGTSAS